MHNAEFRLVTFPHFVELFWSLKILLRKASFALDDQKLLLFCFCERAHSLHDFLLQKSVSVKSWKNLLHKSDWKSIDIMADTEFEEFTDLLDELPQHFKAPEQSYK